MSTIQPGVWQPYPVTASEPEYRPAIQALQSADQFLYDFDSAILEQSSQQLASADAFIDDADQAVRDLVLRPLARSKRWLDKVNDRLEDHVNTHLEAADTFLGGMESVSSSAVTRSDGEVITYEQPSIPQWYVVMIDRFGHGPGCSVMQEPLDLQAGEKIVAGPYPTATSAIAAMYDHCDCEYVYGSNNTIRVRNPSYEPASCRGETPPTTPGQPPATAPPEVPPGVPIQPIPAHCENPEKELECCKAKLEQADRYLDKLLAVLGDAVKCLCDAMGRCLPERDSTSPLPAEPPAPTADVCPPNGYSPYTYLK